MLTKFIIDCGSFKPKKNVWSRNFKVFQAFERWRINPKGQKMAVNEVKKSVDGQRQQD